MSSGPRIAPNEKFNLHSPGVTVEESGTVAVHGPGYGHRYVLGENVYQQGIVNLKFKLQSFHNNDWMFVGIGKGDVVPPANKSYHWRGSYGWEFGRYGGFWRNGSGTLEPALSNCCGTNVTKQGDMVELVLDCDAAKLSLHVPTGQQFHIEIPKSQTWRLNVNLDVGYDKIRIMNE